MPDGCEHTERPAEGEHTVIEALKMRLDATDRMLTIVREDRAATNAAYVAAVNEIANLRSLLDRTAGELKDLRESAYPLGCWSCGCDEGGDHDEDCLDVLVREALK